MRTDSFTVLLAAKAALRRKKLHEKNHESTQAQIAQLEQQIYSIEAANINQETLNAMKEAGTAMAQIHGKLTIDKVDETMYVCVRFLHCRLSLVLSFAIALILTPTNRQFITSGTNFVINTSSVKKSPMQLQTILLANSQTRTSWKLNWRVWNRRQ
jgi:Snf7